jgi:hypothetical protein
MSALLRIVLLLVLLLSPAQPRGTYRSVRGTRPAARRIHRSRAARDAFERSHPCPATGRTSGPCRGYVVDHIQPLVCGGADAPSNMQWRTKAEGKAKDKWERAGCQVK